MLLLWFYVFYYHFLLLLCHLFPLYICTCAASCVINDDDDDTSGEVCYLGGNEGGVGGHGSSDADTAAEATSGSLLCRALVKRFDAVLLKPHDKQQFFVLKATVINALKSLLAVSTAPKTTAIEGNSSS